jgi:type I site-specific restriction-modification system R (restriction) subunit
MPFFVRQLQLSCEPKNPTIVIETDRNNLDQRLFGAFCAHRYCASLRTATIAADPPAHPGAVCDAFRAW